MKREEQLGSLCPGLLMSGCSSSGWQVVVGDNSVAGAVTGLVEWRLVWVRKKRQKLLSVTLFFTLINWIIIYDPCVSLNSEMG